MNRLPLLLAMSLGVTACAPSEFASQCDGLTELDSQVACLDEGFTTLRAAQDRCPDDERTDSSEDRDRDGRTDQDDRDRDDETERDDRDDRNDSDRCRDDRDDRDEERCRDDERERDDDERTTGDVRDQDEPLTEEARRHLEAAEDLTDEERRRLLDDEHFRTRDDVERSDRARDRRDRIREGLTVGEDLARCPR